MNWKPGDCPEVYIEGFPPSVPFVDPPDTRTQEERDAEDKKFQARYAMERRLSSLCGGDDYDAIIAATRALLEEDAESDYLEMAAWTLMRAIVVDGYTLTKPKEAGAS